MATAADPSATATATVAPKPSIRFQEYAIASNGQSASTANNRHITRKANSGAYRRFTNYKSYPSDQVFHYKLNHSGTLQPQTAEELWSTGAAQDVSASEFFGKLGSAVNGSFIMRESTGEEVPFSIKNNFALHYNPPSPSNGSPSTGSPNLSTPQKRRNHQLAKISNEEWLALWGSPKGVGPGARAREAAVVAEGPRPLPPGWREVPAGNSVFYYHDASKTSQKAHPSSYVLPAPRASPSRPNAMDPFVALSRKARSTLRSSVPYRSSLKGSRAIKMAANKAAAANRAAAGIPEVEDNFYS